MSLQGAYKICHISTDNEDSTLSIKNALHKYKRTLNRGIIVLFLFFWWGGEDNVVYTILTVKVEIQKLACKFVMEG